MIDHLMSPYTSKLDINVDFFLYFHKKRRLFKQTDTVECKLCTRWVKNRTHFRNKHQTWMRSNLNPNWEDLVRESNSEFHIVEKIQDAFDTREYGNRGPCFRVHFA